MNFTPNLPMSSHFVELSAAVCHMLNFCLLKMLSKFEVRIALFASALL